MNRTFKVVFNRARSCLVVANEITRTVQKKGTKLVLVASALALSTVPAFASSLVKKTWNDSTVPTWEDEASSDSGVITDGVWNVNATLTGTNADIRGIDIKSGATGKAENLSLKIVAKKEDSEKNSSAKVYGVYGETSDTAGSGELEFSGEKTLIDADSTFTGNIYAVKTNQSVVFAAKQTTLQATFNNATGTLSGGIYGIDISGANSKVVMKGDVDIVAKGTTKKFSGQKYLAYGVHLSSGSSLEVEEGSDKFSVKATLDTTKSFSVKKKAVGAYLEGASTLKIQSKEINAEASGYGFYAKGSSKMHIGNDSTESITINAERYGVYVDAGTAADKTEATLLANTISIGLSGYGVVAGKNSIVDLEGKEEISIEAGVVGISADTGQSEIVVKAKRISITTGTEAATTTGGILANEGSKVNLSGTEKISIDGKYAGINAIKKASVSVVAKEISINSTANEGIYAKGEASVIQVGSSEIGTEKISIEAQKQAILALSKNSITLTGKEITLTSASDESTVWLQNSTDSETAQADATSLTVTADEFTIKNTSTGAGLVAFSNSQVNIDAATTISSATQAIVTRGNSTINININNDKTTKIDGDIVFGKTSSAAKINSYVNINLSGKDSYWKGKAYQSYNSSTQTNLGEADGYGAVTGFQVEVKDGAKWIVTGDSFVNSLTLSGGGTLDASQAKVLNVGKHDPTSSKIESGFTVSGTGNKLILGEDTVLLQQATLTDDATETESIATITLSEGAELITPLSTAFAIEADGESSVVTKVTKRFDVEFAGGASTATLTIPDAFTASASVLAAISEACGDVAFNLENVTVNLDSAVSESGESQTTTISTDITTKSLTGKGNLAITDGKTLTISGENELSEVGTVELVAPETEGIAFSTLKVANQTSVSVSEIKGDGAVVVAENSALEVETLSGSSKISVGEVNGEGATLSVKNLSMTGGSIFVDPAEGFHSTFYVESLGTDNTLNTNITVGNGGLVVFGSTTESEANTALANLGLSNAAAVVYTNKAAKLGSSGSVVIDPKAESAIETYAQQVVIRNGGTLVIDQAALNGATVFEGATGVILGEANFGVLNATIGTIPLGAKVTEDGSAAISLYTDSPFLTATLANDTGIITIAGSASSEGQSVISSLGIQSMIRRADMILAETIADRAAEKDLDSNLWVMVRGERYEQDGLGDGAGFHANMGYGAFGAEVAPTEKTNVGLAFQYGHGTVKGDVGSAKNKTKDYSATLYASALLGDTGIKLLGEVAYTQSSNDITNTYYTGLNQDLDAKMISVAATLQKRFEFEGFSLTPSVGVRVSKLKTDAMKMGSSMLDKQSQTIVQVPIALRLRGKTAQTENGWSVTPRFKLAYIPTFGDKEIDIYGVKKTVLDTSPVQGAFGINFQKGGFSVDATANAGVGNRGTSSFGGKLEMNYRF